MPRFLLKFNAAVIKEIPIEKTPLTIGRKNDNDIVIDHLAVSGHHARITAQGSSFMLEDLQSTNGTFINEKKVLSAALKHNDLITIGQHTLEFLYPESIPSPVTNVDSEATVIMAPPSVHQPEIPSTFPPPKAEVIGSLRVLEGKADQPEYTLSALLTYIGKSENAAIKIKGIFAPDIAALISKKPQGYFITAVKDGYPRLNNAPLSGQVELKDGDVVEAGGIKFLFQTKDKPAV